MTERERRLPLLGGLTIARRVLEATGLFVADDERRRPAPSPSSVPPFQTIYRDYFDFVWSSMARFGVEPSAMDDLVQEVFIVIHARSHTLQDPGALRSWIYGVARRTASNHRRLRRGRAEAGTPFGLEDELRASGPSPLEQTETNAEMQLLASLLAELDEPKREVFELVELQQLTVPEVAALLEIPVNTASSRLRLARQGFEAALARHRARNRGK